MQDGHLGMCYESWNVCVDSACETCIPLNRVFLCTFTQYALWKESARSFVKNILSQQCYAKE